MTLPALLAVLRTWLTAEVDQRRTADRDRGDVPGWVLVTLMTVGIVMAIWAVAEPQLTHLLGNALSIAGDPNK